VMQIEVQVALLSARVNHWASCSLFRTTFYYFQVYDDSEDDSSNDKRGHFGTCQLDGLRLFLVSLVTRLHLFLGNSITSPMIIAILLLV